MKLFRFLLNFLLRGSLGVQAAIVCGTCATMLLGMRGALWLLLLLVPVVVARTWWSCWRDRRRRFFSTIPKVFNHYLVHAVAYAAMTACTNESPRIAAWVSCVIAVVMCRNAKLLLLALALSLPTRAELGVVPAVLRRSLETAKNVAKFIFEKFDGIAGLLMIVVANLLMLGRRRVSYQGNTRLSGLFTNDDGTVRLAA